MYVCKYILYSTRPEASPADQRSGSRESFAYFSEAFHKLQRLRQALTSTTMNSIKYACSLNNQGVELLVSGESARALTTFQSALVILFKKAAVNENEATTPSTDIMDVSCCDDASLPFCGSTSTVPGLQDKHCYVYDHGIIITETANGESDEMLSLYTAIVFFNWAIASHCQGSALGLDTLLNKASRLYSMSVKLLTRCAMPKDVSTTILTLLAKNNQAQIHYYQCEYVQSVDCMNNVLKIMGSVKGLDSSLGYEDVEGLMLNVMLLSIPAAAPAA
jgi:hypothetical protein